MADVDMISLVAAKTGLGRKFISKDEKLSLMIGQLATALKDEFVVLKGGTVLNRVYIQKVARFSEDIDVDLISKLSVAERIKKAKTVMGRVSGFEVSEPKVMHRTARFDCYFPNEFGERDRIRVEFYLSFTRLVAARRPGEVAVSSTFLPSPPSVVKVYSLEDMLARKLTAIHDRVEGKDMYDVFHMLELEFDEKVLKTAIRKMLKFLKLRLGVDEFMKKVAEKLETAHGNWRYIRDSTNHYIPVDQRPNWETFIKSLGLKIESLRESL
ncbi:MAG: nucleotidyl transferase AbiEii/AbiGii toxin family protein [Candidatus Hadarchaeota archaeon]